MCSSGIILAKLSFGCVYDELNKILFIFIGVFPMNCFKMVFLWRTVNDIVLLKIYLILLLMLKMFQFLLMIYFIFGSIGFYVTENVIKYTPLDLYVVKTDILSRWISLNLFSSRLFCVAIFNDPLYQSSGIFLTFLEN